MTEPSSRSPSLKLMLGATGVVFGDIGTSPLYAFRESFIGHHRLPIDQFHVLGVLSMLVWARSSSSPSNMCSLRCAPTIAARAAASRCSP